MTDEKYTFVTDIAEKKRTARGAFNKRTHNGKRGGVKFPSDYMTKKERNKMNGEVKNYIMNAPITYEKFKTYPDDLKKQYVRKLRDMFDVSDTDIAAMMGVNKKTLSMCLNKIGASGGRRGNRKADYVGFEKWKRGETEPNECVQVPVDDVLEDDSNKNLEAIVEKINDVGTPNLLRAHDIDWDEVKRASRDNDVYERVAALEHENAILKAKLDMVYLIFGGKRNDY
jgi:hypothetical protein|nr:MAG TPA: centromere-binding protein [Caudoviricetes sp.]